MRRVSTTGRRILGRTSLVAALFLLLAFPALAQPTPTPELTHTPTAEPTHTPTPQPTHAPTFTPTPSLSAIRLPIVIRGRPAPTPTATWTPVPSCSIRDDFSDESSGWPVSDETHFRLAYLSGEYQVLLKTAPRWVGIAPGFLCVDCAVDVEGRFASDAYGAYGILFGVTDDWNGYFFRVTGDQRYSLYTMVDTYESQPLVDWTFSSAIHAGGTPNHLRLVRQGANIALFANGVLLSTLDDDTYMGNLRVGLSAESYEQAGVDARFDNLALCDVALDATSIRAASANPAMAGGGVLSSPSYMLRGACTPTLTLTPALMPSLSPTRTFTPMPR